VLSRKRKVLAEEIAKENQEATYEKMAAPQDIDYVRSRASLCAPIAELLKLREAGKHHTKVEAAMMLEQNSYVSIASVPDRYGRKLFSNAAEFGIQKISLEDAGETDRQPGPTRPRVVPTIFRKKSAN